MLSLSFRADFLPVLGLSAEYDACFKEWLNAESEAKSAPSKEALSLANKLKFKLLKKYAEIMEEKA